MTITAEFTVHERPWRGYADRGLPVGMWIAQGTVTGDASGTNMTVKFKFKEEGSPLGSRFYNVEQIEVHNTQASVSAGAMVLQNFDIVGPTGLVNRESLLTMSSDGVTTSVLREGDGPRLPMFMGRPALEGLNTTLDFRFFNVLGEVVFATAQGYIWEPRSLLMDGGMRRPVDSLFG